MRKMAVRPTDFNLERLQRDVNILLISDLHYDVKRDSNQKDWMKGKTVNNALVDSLWNFTPEWHPDAVIVAGDLVNHNKEENYELYFDLAEKLTDKFPLLKHAFFSTPGNHDINRENIVSSVPYLFHFLQQKDPPTLKSSFTGNSFIDTIYNTAGHVHDDIPDLRKALIQFEESYFQTYLKKKQELLTDKKIGVADMMYPVEGIKTFSYKSLLGITLVSVNSSFFCNMSQTGQDRNHLFLIRDLVEKTVASLKMGGPIISFMHHPYYYLHESEHIAPTSSEAIDPQNNFNKLVKKSDLILSGHVHGDIHDPSLLQHCAYMVTNGTSYTTDQFENKCYPYTYALLRINKQLGKFSLRKFKYKTVGKSNDNFAFQCINHDHSRCFDFFERTGAPKTSVETEKVRVLHYFKTLDPELADNLKGDFSIHQLRVCFPELPQEEKEYWFDTGTLQLRDSSIEYVHINYAGAAFIIYKINTPFYIAQLREIIRNEEGHFPLDRTILFSINMNLLFENDFVSTNKVEGLKKGFQTDVLINKNEKISIHLLYH